MALTAADLQDIQTLIDSAISAASFASARGIPQRGPRPPDDLVYEGNATYWSPSTKHGYAKGAGGILIDTGTQEVAGG